MPLNADQKLGPTGHRQRLRERFAKSGRSVLPDYELLELLLTFGIPRIDTKPIAKSTCLIRMIFHLEGLEDSANALPPMTMINRLNNGDSLAKPSDIADEILAQLSLATQQMQELARLLGESG
jgi:hypothetical protein